MPHLGLVVDDTGAADIGAGENLGVLGYPNVLRGVVELALGQARTQFQDEGLYFGQDFPGVGLALKELCGYGAVSYTHLRPGATA